MDIIIVGTGPIGKMAYEYFSYDSQYTVVAFAINSNYFKEDLTEFYGLPVIALEKIEDKYPPNKVRAFVAIGNSALNRDRARVYHYMEEKGYSLVSYVSSKAFVWRDVEIGENCFILEDNTLQPFVKIGNNVTLWSGNHIGHESVIGDNCFVSSHVVISGFCDVGENCFIGVNTAIADHVTIAKDNFIALGSVINKNTEENKVYRGNPAVAATVSAKRFSRVEEE